MRRHSDIWASVMLEEELLADEPDVEPPVVVPVVEESEAEDPGAAVPLEVEPPGVMPGAVGAVDPGEPVCMPPLAPGAL